MGQLDCFWAGQGILFPITRLWDPRYDAVKDWSNVVCAKRKDVWLDVLNSFAIEI